MQVTRALWLGVSIALVPGYPVQLTRAICTAHQRTLAVIIDVPGEPAALLNDGISKTMVSMVWGLRGRKQTKRIPPEMPIIENRV